MAKKKSRSIADKPVRPARDIVEKANRLNDSRTLYFEEPPVVGKEYLLHTIILGLTHEPNVPNQLTLAVVEKLWDADVSYYDYTAKTNATRKQHMVTFGILAVGQSYTLEAEWPTPDATTMLPAASYYTTEGENDEQE